MHIAAETYQEAASRQLKAEPCKSWKRRYASSDLSGAIRSAARAAKEWDKAAYVIAGNSYGRACWQVSMEERDVLCFATNSGRRAYRVMPSCDITKLEIAA